MSGTRSALFEDIKSGSPEGHLAYVITYVNDDDSAPYEKIICSTPFDLAHAICQAIRFGLYYDVYLADEYTAEDLENNLFSEPE